MLIAAYSVMLLLVVEVIALLEVDRTLRTLPQPKPVAVPEQVALPGMVTLPSEANVIPSALADELRIASTTIRDIVYPPMVLGDLPLPLQRDLSM